MTRRSCRRASAAFLSLLPSIAMIVSRVAERARLDALLAALVRGEGGALVVHGEAGIGKTALLETLVERCVGVVTVARACGAETEAERAFSALTELLYPCCASWTRCPRRRPPRQVTAWRCASPRSACYGPRPGTGRSSWSWTTSS